MDIYKQFENYGIIPVIKIDHVEDAKPLAKALCEGGLPVAEVTFRSACAKEAMQLMYQEYPDMLIGAGTVLTPKQVDDALEAGAKFIVSPGLNPDVVTYCQEKKVPIIPGCATPSDMEKAISLGLDVVKFFPAEANGGIAAIKAMAAPYSQLRFMPTGGIREDNVKDYLNFDKVIACGGTWMVKSEYLDKKEFDVIKQLTKQAVRKMLDLKVAHIGMNSENESTCESYTKQLALFTLSDIVEYEKSNFVGEIEVMKTPNYGEKGHIGFSTNHVERAKFYLERNGFSFRMESAQYNEKGQLKFIYANEEVNGFALHLVKK